MRKVALLCAADPIQTNSHQTLDLMNATTKAAFVIEFAILFRKDKS